MDYCLLKKIGGGNYGDVFSGSLEIAIKRIPKKLVEKQNLYQELDREREILTKCKSKNIVKLYDYIENEKYYDFLLEKCDTDLSKILKEKKKFSISQIKNIMNQLNNAFKIMQKENIIHRDIKLENILVKYNNNSDNDFIVKLCDFGLSREYNYDIDDSFAGSIETMAPEIMNEDSYNSKVDLWSIGIIMYQMYYNHLPEFDNNDNIIKLPSDENFSNLLEKLLKKNQNERINWDLYFNHPFFLEKEHVNILVIGRKNVGKSTLIKNVLKETNDKNKINNPKRYFSRNDVISNNLTFPNCVIYEKENEKFRFYEMKGYYERRYKFENLLKDINEIIETQLLKKDKDKNINCIWYCFDYEKYNESEQIYIEQLKKFADEKNILICFISTKTKDKLMINIAFEKIIKNNNKKRMDDEEEKYVKCRVLSETMDIINEEGKLVEIIEPFGIKILIRKTLEKLKDKENDKIKTINFPLSSYRGLHKSHITLIRKYKYY
jgi:serine/threonine protein kinase